MRPLRPQKRGPFKNLMDRLEMLPRKEINCRQPFIYAFPVIRLNVIMKAHKEHSAEREINLCSISLSFLRCGHRVRSLVSSLLRFY